MGCGPVEPQPGASSQPLASAWVRFDGEDPAISQCADDRGKWTAGLRGGLLVWAGRAKRYAARNRDQDQHGDATDFRRPAISRKSPGTKLHPFDHKLTRGIRRKNSAQCRYLGKSRA